MRTTDTNFLKNDITKLKYTILLHMVLNFFASVLGGLILTLDQTKSYTTIISAVYSLGVCAIGIAGIILLIIKRHELSLEPGEIVMEKGQRFKTLILNPGMILYCLVLFAIMLAQAFLV